MSDEEREYLNEMIRSLNNRLVDALRERDEARQRYCFAMAEHGEQSEALQTAKDEGWDCFPDKTEADANNTLFRTTDGE